MTDKQLEFEDYYETLEISPNADQETMQAVYRCLAKRYHPDSGETADGQRFIRIRKAYRILSDPDRRSQFDRKLRSIGLHGQRWVKAEAPLNIEEDEYLRKALLWLLYLCRREAVDRPGLGDLELERSLGCSESELSFHLWYLKEKGWVERTDTGAYAITANGVDKVTEGVVLRADRLLSKLTGEQGGGDAAQGQPLRIVKKDRRPKKIKSETGTAVVESAFMLGLLFITLFGIMEVSTLLFNRAIIINASREATRLGAMFDVDPANNYAYAPPTDVEITQRVLDYSGSKLISFGSGTPPQVQVSPSWAARQASGPGTPLRVTVNYQFRFLVLPNLTSGLGQATTLSAETRMRME